MTKTYSSGRGGSFEIIPDSPSDATSPASGDDDGLELRHRPSATPISPSVGDVVDAAPTPTPLLLPLRGSASNPELGAGDAEKFSLLPTSSSELTSIADAASSSIEAVGGRFSKSSTERESILHNRKALLMQQAKK